MKVLVGIGERSSANHVDNLFPNGDSRGSLLLECPDRLSFHLKMSPTNREAVLFSLWKLPFQTITDTPAVVIFVPLNLLDFAKIHKPVM